MATKDYTANMAPAVRPLLDGGERLLAASPLAKDPGTTEDVSVADELTNLLDPTILLGLGTHPGNALQRAVFGRAVTGTPDSMARRLFDAVDGAEGPRVAVTDRRLLIVEVYADPKARGGWRRWLGPADLVARDVHAVPRAAILGAVAAPAGLFRRGRLLVGFADGSGCVLVCAPPSLADPVVEAIGGPRPDGSAAGEEHR
ncbi:MAG TPA: hypothetical protein VI011_02325 [Asanoa sp.]|jgi:hypothetical protein